MLVISSLLLKEKHKQLGHTYVFLKEESVAALPVEIIVKHLNTSERGRRCADGQLYCVTSQVFAHVDDNIHLHHQQSMIVCMMLEWR